MSLNRILIWYRNDLQLRDRQPLHAAIAPHAQIIPIYCFDPRQLNKTSSGFPKKCRFDIKVHISSNCDVDLS
jgi:deoxyribodipyrimidine photo-lyase